MNAAWSPDLRQELTQFIAKWKVQPTRKIAVFDADGTLWREDIGEGFFQYQIKHGLIPKTNYPAGADLWQLYLQTAWTDAPHAYGWLAQLQRGVKEPEIRAAARNFYEQGFHKNVFPQMAKLVFELRGAGFEVWICSASIRWAVEPGARSFQVDDKRLIAVTTEVVDGVITDKILQPLPYKEGKRAAIEKIIGCRPLLVAGNSTGDTAMLEYAQEISLVIGSAPSSSLHYPSEQQVQKIAEERDWLVQQF